MLHRQEKLSEIGHEFHVNSSGYARWDIVFLVKGRCVLIKNVVSGGVLLSLQSIM